MVGWHPDVVDYAKWPGLTPENLEAALRNDEPKLNELGYSASIHLIRDGTTAAAELADLLKATPVVVVMIGAGVRRDEDHFLVFEQLINAVHAHAPKARIAFNTGPKDSLAAVQRWG
jgi:hypothetical protein